MAERDEFDKKSEQIFKESRARWSIDRNVALISAYAAELRAGARREAELKAEARRINNNYLDVLAEKDKEIADLRAELQARDNQRGKANR